MHQNDTHVNWYIQVNTMRRFSGIHPYYQVLPPGQSADRRFLSGKIDRHSAIQNKKRYPVKRSVTRVPLVV